jgi:hypothetical protein
MCHFRQQPVRIRFIDSPTWRCAWDIRRSMKIGVQMAAKS